MPQSRAPANRDRDRWSAPSERIAVVAMLVFVLVCCVAAVTYMGIDRDLDKSSITAILGTIAGGCVTAISHKLSSRG